VGRNRARSAGWEQWGTRSIGSSCPQSSGAQDIDRGGRNRSLEAGIEGIEIERFSLKTARFLSKPIDFLFSFYEFYIILHFDEFCRTRCFKNFNHVLTKNLEIDSRFLEFFI
jgi:hypothetical protein